MKNAGKYTAFDHTPGSTHNLLLGLIPPGAKVLEFGCATGYMSRELSRRLGCNVVGVEVVPDAAQLAEPYCSRVIVGDASAMDFNALFGDEKFDVILFADVLVRFHDPLAVLKKVSTLLSPTGAVVCSVPNIAHGSVRLSLLAGEFNYSKRGLLDDTHLRFFTLKTLSALFADAGLSVSRLLKRRVPSANSEIFIPPLPPDIVRWVESQPEANAYQYIVRAVPESQKSADALRSDYLGAQKQLDAPDAWVVALEESLREIETHVPKNSHFVLIDEAHWHGTARWNTLVPHPFPEIDDSYYGPPADDASAIRELQRQLDNGVANEIVIAWPAFWWLEHYSRFAQFLAAYYAPVLDNDRIKILRRN